MKVYTSSDLQTFERNSFGYLLCPSGDYTAIYSFDISCCFDSGSVFADYSCFNSRCFFGDSCRFGKFCTFTSTCRFGSFCVFGDSCTFGELSVFEHSCTFGYGCIFHDYSTFATSCTFGDDCRFGHYCSFGGASVFGLANRFGENCAFDGLCTFEGGRVSNGRFFVCNRIGPSNASAYFFKGTEGCFVRLGSWFVTFQEFECHIKCLYFDSDYLSEYLLALDLARVILR